MNSKYRATGFRLFLFITFCFYLSSCGVPNLESPGCAEARTAVREFYSFHFGNDMRFSHENLKQRERFLTPEFTNFLMDEPEGMDPFTTNSADLPKAFRVGECKEMSPDRAEFQVLLFWRDDTRTEQREILVPAARSGGKWLIDRILF